MTQLEILRNALFDFAQLGKEDFDISIPFWETKEFKKGDFYNACGCVCNYLGFTTEGYFRAYLMNEEGIEKNIFLYLPHQIVVAYKSFIHEIPCNYYTQAITESQAICIDHKDLQSLYLKSHGWERFGRLVAERAFDIANNRAESFFFKSAEERYMDLIRLQPDIVEHIPLYHISSYLGIAGPSLSRIRRRILRKRYDFNRG